MAQGTRDGKAEMSEKTVKSVDTLFTIIEQLKEKDGMGVTELSQELDMSKGGVHRYLQSLVANGYAVNDDGTYRLSLLFLDFGTYVHERNSTTDVIEPKVQQLAQDTGERAQYIVPEHGQGIYLCRKRGQNAVKTNARVGKVVYFHTTAAGKAILAHLPDERIGAILDRHGLVSRTAETITDQETLWTEIEEIREQGFALNKDEHVKGLWAVGAPVQSTDNAVLGGLSVSGPSNRIRERIENNEIHNTLLGITNEIELNLKYS